MRALVIELLYLGVLYSVTAFQLQRLLLVEPVAFLELLQVDGLLVCRFVLLLCCDVLLETSPDKFHLGKCSALPR